MNNLGSGPKEATNTIAMSMNAVKIMTIIKVITIKMIMLTSTNPKSSILMIQEMTTWRNRTKEWDFQRKAKSQGNPITKIMENLKP